MHNGCASLQNMKLKIEVVQQVTYHCFEFSNKRIIINRVLSSHKSITNKCVIFYCYIGNIYILFLLFCFFFFVVGVFMR